MGMPILQQTTLFNKEKPQESMEKKREVRHNI
jgi:hypothetical protein